MDKLIETIKEMRNNINNDNISNLDIEQKEKELYKLAQKQKVDDNKLVVLIDFVESKIVVLQLIELLSNAKLKEDAYFKKLDKYIDDYKSQNIEDEYHQIKVVRSISDYIDMLSKLSIEDSEKKRYIDRIINNHRYRKLFYEAYDYDYLQYSVYYIIIGLKHDSSKIEYLDKLNNIEAKVKILKSMTDKKMLMDYLDKNPEVRRELIRSIYMYDMHDVYRIVKMWDFVKLIEAENEIIPHLLSNSRYKLLERFPTDILEDVKTYFNGNIPNVDTLSEYEKIGIDESVLTDKVISNEAQLNLDELQKKFFGVISGKFQNSKKKISIRDFGGTLSYNGDEKNRIETLEDLLKKSNRSEINLIRHSDDILFEPDDNKEKMGLRGIDGKFYVFLNGNHRLSMLKARYLTEIKRAEKDLCRIQHIEDEYSIYVSYAVELPTNNTELVAISVLAELFDVQENGLLIGELVEKGRKTGYQIFNQAGERVMSLRAIDEIKKYIDIQIQLVQKNVEFNSKWNEVTKAYLSNPKYKEIFKSIIQQDIQQDIKQDIKQNNSGIPELLKYMKKCAKHPEMINNKDKAFFIELKDKMIKVIINVIQRLKDDTER